MSSNLLALLPHQKTNYRPLAGAITATLLLFGGRKLGVDLLKGATAPTLVTAATVGYLGGSGYANQPNWKAAAAFATLIFASQVQNVVPKINFVRNWKALTGCTAVTSFLAIAFTHIPFFGNRPGKAQIV